MPVMQINEALNALGDGHSIWKPDYAKRVCKALGVPFDNSLIHTFRSDPVGTFKGITMNADSEGAKAVDGGSLAYYVARKLGVADSTPQYFGRGKQARAYAEAVANKLKGMGKLNG